MDRVETTVPHLEPDSSVIMDPVSTPMSIPTIVEPQEISADRIPHAARALVATHRLILTIAEHADRHARRARPRRVVMEDVWISTSIYDPVEVVPTHAREPRLHAVPEPAKTWPRTPPIAIPVERSVLVRSHCVAVVHASMDQPTSIIVAIATPSAARPHLNAVLGSAPIRAPIASIAVSVDWSVPILPHQIVAEATARIFKRTPVIVEPVRIRAPDLHRRVVLENAPIHKTIPTIAEPVHMCVRVERLRVAVDRASA